MRKMTKAALGACALALTMSGTTAANAAEPGGGVPIIGGHNATQTYSWMGTLSNGCGASLIAPQWLSTADHCGFASQVRLGSNSKNSGGEVRQIDDAITRPGSDLTLMHLSSPAQGTPVRMASSNPAPGSSVRLLGWGCTSWPSCRHPETLQEIDLTILPSSSCFPGGGDPEDVCVSGDQSHSACHGDSGGPAIVDGTLVGVTHGAGDGNGECATTTLYQGVAAYLPWINEQIGG